jgi:Trypsin-co-occurring domain 1
VKRVISYPLDAGSAGLIEVEDGGATVTRGLHPAAEVVETVEAIRPAAVTVTSKFRNFADAPKDVEVEFGLEYAGQVDAFIASANTDVKELDPIDGEFDLKVSTDATNRP